MSRVGIAPITIPEGVTLSTQDNNIIVKGPKGELTFSVHKLISLNESEAGILKVERKNETKEAKSLHGTTQRIISNMIIGVTQGFQKTLDLVGTGYRVAKQGDKITLSLGFSHPVEYKWPQKINVDIEGNNKIIVSGIDKQEVGQVAATIRSFRPPEPYKGKGIKYSDEIIRRKAGKAAKAAA